MIPVVVYPEDYISKINDEVGNLKENIKAGRQPFFNSVDALVDLLENENNND